MGVDASLFVLSPHSCLSVGTVEHVFTLQCDRDLWGPLRAALRSRKRKTWPVVQLPHGSRATYMEGHPEGMEGQEGGFLESDSYGGPMDAIQGAILAGVVRVEDGSYPGWDGSFNRAVFDFIVEHFPDRDVVVFWH